MKQKILASTTAIRTACGTMETAINGLSGVVSNDLFNPLYAEIPDVNNVLALCDKIDAQANALPDDPPQSTDGN